MHARSWLGDGVVVAVIVVGVDMVVFWFAGVVVLLLSSSALTNKQDKQAAKVHPTYHNRHPTILRNWLGRGTITQDLG